MSQKHVGNGAAGLPESAESVDELAFQSGAPTRGLLLSAADVAVLLAISVRTLWRLDSAGKLPRSVPVGGCKRWRREELVAWISAGCPARSEWQWGNAIHARSIPRFVEGGK